MVACPTSGALLTPTMATVRGAVRASSSSPSSVRRAPHDYTSAVTVVHRQHETHITRLRRRAVGAAAAAAAGGAEGAGGAGGGSSDDDIDINGRRRREDVVDVREFIEAIMVSPVRGRLLAGPPSISSCLIHTRHLCSNGGLD